MIIEIKKKKIQRTGGKIKNYYNQVYSNPKIEAKKKNKKYFQQEEIKER